MNTTRNKRRSRPPLGLKPAPIEEVNDYDAFDAEEDAPSTVARATLREDMREDSLERARRRTAELKGTVDPYDDGTDEFYVPKDAIPDGWTYEWKRHKVYNQEESSYIADVARRGWDYVPASRHPEMMPTGYRGMYIERKGLVLMEKPTEIVDENRQLELRKARSQVRAKEQQLGGTPEGTMTRDHAQTRPKISKSFEAVPIPKE